MTLVSSGADSALFFAESAPVTNRPEDITAWAARQFARLEQFLRQPEVSELLCTPTNTVLDPLTKVQDGLVLYGMAGVFGAAEGLYLREAGAWKRIQTL
jgi:hypothetical protein